jgi:hypothetical protein
VTPAEEWTLLAEIKSGTNTSYVVPNALDIDVSAYREIRIEGIATPQNNNPTNAAFTPCIRFNNAKADYYGVVYNDSANFYANSEPFMRLIRSGGSVNQFQHRISLAGIFNAVVGQGTWPSPTAARNTTMSGVWQPATRVAVTSLQFGDWIYSPTNGYFYTGSNTYVQIWGKA